MEQEAAQADVSDDRDATRALRKYWPPATTAHQRCLALLERDVARTVHPKGVGLLERRAGVFGVALLWGAMFWDCAARGAEELESWDLASMAFAGGQLVLTATAAAAPDLLRRHAEFERERRLGRCHWPEYARRAEKE